MTPNKPKSRTPEMKPAFILLMILLAAYAVFFIQRTSFEIGGTRYYCLFDDAMISMRYAKNLASGMGLVWNIGGERVEGVTNPLWVFYMSIFHLLPIPAAQISAWIQVTGAVCLLFTVMVVRKLALLLFPGSKIAEYVPAIFTAAYFPLLNWSLQGMEVGPLTLIVAWSAWLAVRGLQEGRMPVSLYWVLGASTMLRLDVVSLCAILLAATVPDDRKNRRRHLVLGISILFLFLGVQTIGRYLYYGELLPNTYFLKVTGLPLVERLLRGAETLLGFMSGMTWIVFLFPFILLMFRPARGVTLLAILFLTQCAYSVFVGGDAWEWWGGSNRYISIVMPLFFVLFGGALARLVLVLESFNGLRRPYLRYLGIAGVSLILLASLFRLNNVKGMASGSDWMNGGKYLASTGLSKSGVVLEWLLMPDPLDYGENIRTTKASFLLDSITTPGARVAVVFAGAMPYFSDREFIDLLGKNDKIIARAASRPTLDPMGALHHTPGHSKWSYAYSIGELRPDVVYELWANREEARPYLEAEYETVKLREHTWYFLRASEKIRWPILAQLIDAHIVVDQSVEGDCRVQRVGTER